MQAHIRYSLCTVLCEFLAEENLGEFGELLVVCQIFTIQILTVSCDIYKKSWFNNGVATILKEMVTANNGETSVQQYMNYYHENKPSHKCSGGYHEL